MASQNARHLLKELAKWNIGVLLCDPAGLLELLYIVTVHNWYNNVQLGSNGMEYWIVGPQVRAPSISQEWSWELFRLTNIIQIIEPFRPSTPGWWLAYVYGPWYISAMRFYVYGGAPPPSFALGFRVYTAEHRRPRSP